MSEYIDIYCERLEPGLLAEPLNLFTNISFFVAAWAFLLLSHRLGRLKWDASILGGLIFMIGIGSSLFHAFATYQTMMADVIPILIYQMAFLTLYIRFVINKGWIFVLGAMLVFFAMTVGFEQLPRAWMNGSLGYMPALIFLAGLGIWETSNADRERYTLLLASCVFVLSLTLRSLDMYLCSDISFGVHFMWHVLNGVVLYLSARSYIVHKSI